MPTATAAPSALAVHLARILDRERVLTRPIELIAHASDASFYRLIPQAVVLPRSIAEVQALFRFNLIFATGGCLSA